jgi:hypothetical protein
MVGARSMPHFIVVFGFVAAMAAMARGFVNGMTFCGGGSDDFGVRGNLGSGAAGAARSAR